jgi:hypothetical protein
VTIRAAAASKEKGELLNVAQTDTPHLSETPRVSPHRTRNRWLVAIGSVLAVFVLAVVIAAEYAIKHAEPVLRASVIQSLSARFHSPVELDEMDVSISHGIVVHGSGLRILYLAGPTQPSMTEVQGKLAPPMLSVKNFSFRISLHDIKRMNARIAIVKIDGLEVHIPPHSDDGVLTPHDTQQPAKKPRINLVFGKILCSDAKLFIETTKPGKDPLEFDINNLQLTDVGIGQPMLYQADIINPRPKGNVHAFGHFGPWQSADPRASAIDGIYTFEHADLNTIKGLGGILSSTGHYNGQLGHILVDGTTSTPDFSLDISNHPVPLLTTFHAFVDGTSGDTTLNSVQATLGHSQFTCAGAVMRIHGEGHDIALTVDMPSGHMDDLLQLAMKANPPVMSGTVAMKAKLHIPPGPVRVAAKIELAGTVDITAVHFSNAKLQDRIDGLSMRAQGKPEEVKAASSDHRAEVASQMNVRFSLAHEMMTIPSLHYQMPGAKVDLDGVYALNGNLYEFKGHVRTEATASQMTTGWKSFLLKAADPFLKKNGAGVELPISISGAKNDIHFGLAFKDADETPTDMSKDIKSRRQSNAAAPR